MNLCVSCLVLWREPSSHGSAPALGYEQNDGLHFAEKETESLEFLMASHGALSIILRRYPNTIIVLLFRLLSATGYHRNMKIPVLPGCV